MKKTHLEFIYEESNLQIFDEARNHYFCGCNTYSIWYIVILTMELKRKKNEETTNTKLPFFIGIFS